MLVKFAACDVAMLRAHGFLALVYPVVAVPKYEGIVFVGTRPIQN